ncbi:efflux transporter outer membrane subunit [Variovorax arabinosiphilus]|uniref:efflux transporter outer membrane subunit n=1 Tax=Variovorax arabinosiphilus TaxID=3053498 RepID=UPI002577E264|nr:MULTISPECIES: efflux transporter outer membrane subunit [unclassified Variovorax]MDM0119777.1 efflux transporter outer membrane subunit [Variovorax sp. J2L1-78]MDM0128311.1 efflux transporter outer membrane subunit [Variovorax sp. J2L1-63]MDM0232011.1 efflux transporter outer membrane subunit [Variovorax sp. J2R1-6]
MRKNILTLAACLLLAGCAAPGADTARAAPVLPATWRDQPAALDDAISADWWRAFGSPELDVLVARARVQSFDVEAAVARVARAEAAATAAGAALWPRVDARVDAQREGRLGGAADAARSVEAGFGLRYDVDAWGRLRSTRDGAQRTAQASAFERDAVQLGVTAAAAELWLQAVALTERVGIAALNLQNAERLLALVEARARAGAATPLEQAQQRGLAAAQRRSLATLQQQAGDARTALSLLLGEAAGVDIRTASLDGMSVPRVGSGLPAVLLARRPDIAAAEARLAAADADVAAARAAMLPAITLGGGIGLASDRLRTLFDNPLYTLTAGLAAPIFDASRLAAEADQASARRRELLSDYRKAIVTAFGDVEIALNAQLGTDAQAAAQAEELRQARSAARLAESRYRAGADTLLTLLDAQRTLYAAQDAAVQAQLARLRARVALFKALGGGWQPAG